jgi:hypothetical protein
MNHKTYAIGSLVFTVGALTQTEHAQAARANTQLRASVNNGKPPIAATSRPGAFSEPGAVAATEAGAVHNAAPPAAPNVARPNTVAVHPSELAPVEHPAAPPTTGNAKQDKQFQDEQDKLVAKQSQERLELQKKQEEDHQRLASQNADAATTQKLEEQHQQETQQLALKHAKEMEVLKARQQPPKQDQTNTAKDKQ